MCKNILRFFLAVFAVITAVIGIYITCIRNKILDQNIYKETLSQSNIYSFLPSFIASSIISSPTTQLGLPQDEAKNQESLLIIGFLKELQVENLFQETVNHNIDNIFSWFKGETGQIIIYFPRKKFIESFDIEKLKSLIIEIVKEEYKNLPLCTNEQLFNMQNNMTSNSMLPPCKVTDSPVELNIIITGLENELNKQFISSSLAEEALKQAGLDQLNEHTPLSTLLSTLDPKTAYNITNTFDTIRNIIYILGIIGYAFIIISILLTLVVLLLGRLHIKFFLTNSGNIYIVVGLILTIIGLFSIFVNNLLINSMIEQTRTNNLDLMDYQEISAAIVNHLISPFNYIILIPGLIILGVSIIIRIIAIPIPLPIISPQKEEQNLKKTSDATK